MINIAHTDECRCVVADDGAVYVRLPCRVSVRQGVVTRHRVQQLAFNLRRLRACKGIP